MKKIMAITAFLAVFFSCENSRLDVEASGGRGKSKMIFYASSADTRTSLQDGKNVCWTEGDMISVFSSGDLQSNECFVSSEISGSSAVFSGSIVPGDTYYAVYPYVPNAVFTEKDNTITISLPSVQKAVASGFETSLNPSLAISEGDNLVFQNLCALVKFTVPQGVDNLEYVRLNTNDNKGKLSGDLKISVTDMTSKVDGLRDHSIKLEGPFLAGKSYYFVVAPVAFDAGLSIVAETADGKIYSKTSSTSITLAGGAVLNLGSLGLDELNMESGIALVGNHYLISNAEGLKEFASIVNGGKRQAQALLVSDIDMAGVTDWTPIGTTSYSFNYSNPEMTVNGNHYAGVFDGNGFSIRNINFAFNPAESSAIGLFGVVKFAVIKNLNLGAPDGTDKMTVTSSLDGTQTIEFGTLAGVCYDSRFLNVNNYVDIAFAETVEIPARSSVGVVGLMYSDAYSVTSLKNFANYGTIKIDSDYSINDMNKALHVGGISGAAIAHKTTGRTLELTGCSNEGEITGTAGRMAGIVASVTTKLTMTDCVNKARIRSNADYRGRAGGLMGVIWNDNTVTGSNNTGNIVSTNCWIGGIACLANNGSNRFTDCSSTGRVITNNVNRGLFLSAVPSGSGSVWSNCIAGGIVGTFNGGDYVYDNYDDPELFLYNHSSATSGEITLEGITYSFQ